MAVREGVLRKQPLFYVVAAIRFEPWMLLREKIPAIQDVLRERFPVFNQLLLSAQGIPSGVKAPDNATVEESALKPNAWAFHRQDRKIGCQISFDQIVIHATEYSRFTDFAEHVKFVLDVYLTFARHTNVHKIGIRYLDLIAPSSGESLSDYMPAAFLPYETSNEGYPLLGGHSQSSYKTQDGVLQARFWTGQNMLMVPNDLVPIHLLTQDTSVPNFLQALPHGQGILDTDSIWFAPEPPRMTADAILERLARLHAHANAFFRIVCSDRAFQVWQGE
jgi:uncharacterized protein (TIGR04255 family)